MSRTAKQDIASSIHITIMRHATQTDPAALIKFRTTLRSGEHAAYVADLSTPSFVDFFNRCPVRNRFVLELVSKGRPRSIVDALCHRGFGERLGIDVAHGDVIEFGDQTGRQLVQKIAPSVADLSVDIDGLPFLPGPLNKTEPRFERAIKARSFDFLPGAERGEILEAQIDANAGLDGARLYLGNLDHDVQEPMATRVTRKIRAVLDLAVGQRAAVEHPERVAGKTKGVTRPLQVPALERNPTKGSATAPAQKRSLELGARLGVLLADGVDRARVQVKLFAAPGGQYIQLEAAGPLFAPTQRMLLRLSTKVPDEVCRSGLFVQKPIQRLDSVAINLDHSEHYSLLVCNCRERLSTREKQRFSAYCALGLCDKTPAQGIGRSGDCLDATALRQSVRHDGVQAAC